MVSPKVATSIRFSSEDIQIMDRLQKITGLETVTAVIRLAIRETLVTRDTKPRKPRK